MVKSKDDNPKSLKSVKQNKSVVDDEFFAEEDNEIAFSRIRAVPDKVLLKEDRVIITAEGLQKLRDELKELKEVKRKEVASRLEEAISYGDLSENAEYEEAKNEQAFCEGRIVELEKMIKNAQIIDDTNVNKAVSVRIGTTVIIKNLTKEEPDMTFTIVGSTEADPFANRISNESPIGKALINKQKGDKIKITAPGGEFEFELLKIN